MNGPAGMSPGGVGSACATVDIRCETMITVAVADDVLLALDGQLAGLFALGLAAELEQTTQLVRGEIK